jgi:anaerobic selenocysteine-containing dehydrogenase
MYAKNDCVFSLHLPETMHYMRNWNREYLDFAKDKGWRQKNDVVQLTLYSDTLQAFRLAAKGQTAGRQPPEHLRERIATYFDPLPFWYAPLEDAATDTAAYPLNAITQRPMAMYHSWDSQNAWLRQIHSHNYLHVNPLTAQKGRHRRRRLVLGRERLGARRCMLRYSEAVEPGTVWTWNAIGKADGAWQLAPGADEARKGFLLNHLINDELPHGAADDQQLRSRDRPGGLVRRARAPRAAEPEPLEASSPQIAATPAPPGVRGASVCGCRRLAGRRRP